MKKAALLIILFSTSIFAQGARYGVFVGVGKYPSVVQLESIESTSNDASGACKAFFEKCDNGNSVLLLDGAATREKIIGNILTFQKKVVTGDTFFFYYSGHGTLFPDRYSEELDEEFPTKIVIGPGPADRRQVQEKFDSALVPYNSTEASGKAWRSLILDDELYRLFAGFTQKGAKVVFISDSCFSAGQSKGVFEEEKKQPGPLGLEKYFNWMKAIGIKDTQELKRSSLVQYQFKPDPSLKNRYVMMASSGENESSFSANPYSNEPMSLFTYHLLAAVEKHKKSGTPFTFETFTNEVKDRVVFDATENNLSQTPLIDSDFYAGGANTPLF
jgi:hypothetical protein